LTVNASLRVGQPGPRFTAQRFVDQEFKDVSLAGLPRQVKVVLFFYPLDFTFDLSNGNHGVQWIG